VELFVKVGSFYPKRENFRLTPDLKQSSLENWNTVLAAFSPQERGGQAMDLRIRRFPKVRSWPRPEDGLRTLVEQAPQAEAWAEQMSAKLRPTLSLLYGIRRRLATAGVAALTVWLFVHVMFGANGMVVYRQKKTEYQTLQNEIDGLQQENDRYTRQIKALQTDPKTIEKEAREQLHYARPGEVIYVPPPSPPPPQTTEINSARK